MMIILTGFLIISLIILFWILSLLVMQIISSPTVYANDLAIERCFETAGLKKNDLLVDLGCGNAKSLIIASEKFGAKGIGIDLSPWCYIKSKINILFSGQRKNVIIIYGDFKKIDKYLKKADIIYLYLLNKTLADIEGWLFNGIKASAKVVSLSFWFPNRKPAKVSVTKNLGRETKIYLYTK